MTGRKRKPNGPNRSKYLSLSKGCERTLIRIGASPGNRSRGVMRIGGQVIPVTLGRGGILANKHEGDGATPRGMFHPLRLWWRHDRTARPRTSLPVRAIVPTDAWCEDPADRRYNRSIRVARDAVGDRLMRADHLYDFIVEIDHNTRPRIAGRGSAVFIHLARENFGPTAGCVGLKRNDMLRFLAKLTTRTKIVIG